MPALLSLFNRSMPWSYQRVADQETNFKNHSVRFRWKNIRLLIEMVAFIWDRMILTAYNFWTCHEIIHNQIGTLQMDPICGTLVFCIVLYLGVWGHSRRSSEGHMHCQGSDEVSLFKANAFAPEALNPGAILESKSFSYHSYMQIKQHLWCQGL